jgi:capsular exopolysaccharide synthesis family protein
MNYISKRSASLLHEKPDPIKVREDELDALAFFRLIRRNLRLILAVTAVITVFAIPIILSSSRAYYAETRLIVHKPLTSNLLSSQTNATNNLDLRDETERLTSRGVALRLIQQFNLMDSPEFNPALRETTLTRQMLDAMRRWITGDVLEAPSNAMDQVIQEFLSALSIRRNGQSEVIQIGFTSQDPELAARVANAIFHAYLGEREEQLREQVQAAREWVTKQIQEQHTRTAKAQLAVRQFREINGLISNDTQANTLQMISTLSGRQAEIMRARLDLSATLSRLEPSSRMSSKIEIIDSPVAAQLVRDHQIQQAELTKLLQTYGDNHSEVVLARSKIRNIEEAIAKEVDRFSETLKAKIDLLDREQSTIRTELSSARANLSRAATVEPQLSYLLTKVQMEQASLDKLEQQGLALARQEAVPAAEVEVLSPAAVPLQPQGRSRMLVALGTLVAAGFIGLTAAGIRELLDNSVRSLQQFEGTPRVRPAGSIPVASNVGASQLIEAIRTQPSSMFVDAVRGLKLSLERSCGGEMPKVTLITSAYPNEGKSSLAVALATELSVNGKQVLLVDGDLRRGTISSFFHKEDEPGLADFLCGSSDIADIIHYDDISGISYIPRGETHSIPANVGRQKISHIIQAAHDRGQLVIIDSAPVLATSETSLLAELSEQVLLIVRWGKTPRHTIDLAVRRLNALTGGDVALAVNMVDPRQHALYGFKDACLFTGELRKYFPEGT